MGKRIRISVAILLATVAALLSVLFVIGEVATAPVKGSVGEAPFDLPIDVVSFADDSGKIVKAWSMNGRKDRGVILLLHGIRSDRRSVLGRARFLWTAGYSVLMIDQQAHGESAGERITFGYLEANSVIAAVAFARFRWPEKRLGVIGLSMGGAASVLAARHSKADAYVLEAVYSSLRAAAENRLTLRFGGAGQVIAPLLLWQVPLRLGFEVDDLSTLDGIRHIGSPLLIIAGGKDRRTTLDDSKALYSRAGDPKSLWVLPDAGHQDFHAISRVGYEKRVLDFLQRYLE